MTKSQNKRLHNRHLLSSNREYVPSAVWLPGLRLGSQRGIALKDSCQDAAGSPKYVMMRRLHFAFFIALISLGTASVYGASHGSVSGVVRDSSGQPQIGAVVQLLRPDLSVIATVYTDSQGRFLIRSVLPGHYAVKAMNMSFLPSLRENVRVRTSTIVNLTLSTLYEVMQWLPAQPRGNDTEKDDWAWTLRSASNRPLLRWLEDGPLVVVTDGPGSRPRLKARLMATGQQGSFGESGERITAAVENTPSNSRALLARVDFAPGTDAGMESLLGFRQDLGFTGSVQSVAAVAVHPEIQDSGSQGVAEAAVRSWETMNLGDELDVEAGSEQVVARFTQNSPNTLVAALPFAAVGWHAGDSTVRYRMTTYVPSMQADESQPAFWMPQLSVHDGEIAVEHGMHQEIGWERHTDASGMSVLFFADSMANPVVEAAVHVAGGSSLPLDHSVLFDPVSGLLQGSGPDFSTTGMVATVEHRVPGGNRIRLSYANGDALVVPVSTRFPSLSQTFMNARPRRVQTYALALSGTLDGTRTHWRASYRWQPADTVTQVAPYAVDAIEPYLTLHIRQPIRVRRDGASGIEALLDVRNLLAEGYQPYLLSDGSLLLFAQQQRSIRGGLAFTF